LDLPIARFGLWFETFILISFVGRQLFPLPVRSVTRRDEAVATMKASASLRLWITEIISIIGYFRNRL
jgi:hypothetical protein